ARAGLLPRALAAIGGGSAPHLRRADLRLALDRPEDRGRHLQVVVAERDLGGDAARWARMASISDFVRGRSLAARCSRTVTPKYFARPRSCSSSLSAGILSTTFA